MANPRQRRKQKSSSQRSVKTTSTTKALKQREIRNVPREIAEQWDKKLTVRQNYAKLGLLPSLALNASGGSDKEAPSKLASSTPSTTSSSASSSEKPIPKGHARIVRDEQGNVVDIIFAAEDIAADEARAAREKELTPWGAPLGEAEVETVPFAAGVGALRREKTDAVKALEERAALGAPAGRKTSNDEMAWLLKTVAKHGRDTDAAARDIKLNEWQKTKGEIGRAVKRAGGWEHLEALVAQRRAAGEL